MEEEFARLEGEEVIEKELQVLKASAVKKAGETPSA